VGRRRNRKKTTFSNRQNHPIFRPPLTDWGFFVYRTLHRKLGITLSSLFRSENCQQSITLKTLQQITDRLKCSWSDSFGWS
jgi:hypothetical protein